MACALNLAVVVLAELVRIIATLIRKVGQTAQLSEPVRGKVETQHFFSFFFLDQEFCGNTALVYLNY